MTRAWFGNRTYFHIDINIGGDDQVSIEVPLSGPNVDDGDTIVRTLFGWYMQTDLVDNSSGLQRAPWPMIVKLTYEPDPDGEPVSSNPPEVGGAALWRESVQWWPLTWTDGTLFATKWTAHSGALRSAQGQRVIQDKTTALLRMGVGYDAGGSGFGGDTDWIPVVVNGFLWVEYLLLQK